MIIWNVKRLIWYKFWISYYFEIFEFNSSQIPLVLFHHLFSSKRKIIEWLHHHCPIIGNKENRIKNQWPHLKKQQLVFVRFEMFFFPSIKKENNSRMWGLLWVYTLITSMNHQNGKFQNNGIVKFLYQISSLTIQDVPEVVNRKIISRI